ncbi:hypothetical protein [Gymnodinialimonas hymeniacidonis]|uniref:hypothetical protein n=1 Tax=Gymnodinialimonas hymeniacidonis TaxID=3126508 RepID=UPI0034C6100C
MQTLVALGRGFLDRVIHRSSRQAGELERMRPDFDPDFYLAQFSEDDLLSDPLVHYLRTGWQDGLDPHPDFSTNGYLNMHLDVADAGMNPLLHYVTFGRDEGREVPPSHVSHLSRQARATAAINSAQQLDRDAVEVADEIDLAFYEATSGRTFPDAVAAARHYLQIGWEQGLDPTATFSTRAYLSHYPDIADANIPPFLHYIRAGRAEGRLAQDRADDVARILAASPTLESVENDWLFAHPEQVPMQRELGAQQLLAAVEATSDRLILAFTHDDFLKIRGGIQLCVGKEMRHAEEHGIGYIALHPARPRPRLAPLGESPVLYATIAGNRIGPLHIDSVLDVARRFRDSRKIDIVLHALLGHSPEDIAALSKSAGTQRLNAWLHDQFFLCPSYALQSNLVRQCGAPEPSSTACRMCLFGEERHEHLSRLRALLQLIPTLAIAPSKAAADIVFSKGDLPFERFEIVPHAHLSEGPAKAAPKLRQTTIAFIGAPKRHKGYATFRDIARRNLGRDDVRFLYFGSAKHVEPGVPTIPVDVTAETPTAMIDALERETVDFVLHWAQFVETYSFATVEAMQAGAHVITHAESGNVAALVRETGRGHIFEDTHALDAFLDRKTLAKATRQRRKKQRVLLTEPSTLSFSVLDKPVKPAAQPKQHVKKTTAQSRKVRAVS